MRAQIPFRSPARSEHHRHYYMIAIAEYIYITGKAISMMMILPLLPLLDGERSISDCTEYFDYAAFFTDFAISAGQQQFYAFQHFGDDCTTDEVELHNQQCAAQ